MRKELKRRRMCGNFVTTTEGKKSGQYRRRGDGELLQKLHTRCRFITPLVAIFYGFYTLVHYN
jgi:hypothetical protein